MFGSFRPFFRIPWVILRRMHYSEAKLVPIFAENGILPEYYKPPDDVRGLESVLVEEEHDAAAVLGVGVASPARPEGCR